MKIQRLIDDREVIQNQIEGMLNIIIEHQNKSLEAFVKESLQKQGYEFNTKNEFYDFCKQHVRVSYNNKETKYFVNDILFLTIQHNASTIGKNQNMTFLCIT